MLGNMDCIGVNFVSRYDSFVNVTRMCADRGSPKDFQGWLDAHRDFVAHVEKTYPNRPCILKDGRGDTWVHPSVAIQVAIWLCPEFALFVSENLRHHLN
jgi:hypothetical protein